MNVLTEAKINFKHEINKIAKRNLIHKFERQGINYHNLPSSEFNELLNDEIEIIKHDSKNMGKGIGIGFVLSMLIGF